MPAVNTRDLDLDPILTELSSSWPEDWTAAERTRGAFHGVALLDGLAVRIAVGLQHRERSVAEAANHAAFATLGLPYRSPYAVREPYTTPSWTAVAYDRLGGEPLPDQAPWSAARDHYLPVLEALKSVPAQAASGLRPVRAWCGGQAWADRVRETTTELASDVRALAERLVARICSDEDGVTPGLIHGDLTPWNVLRSVDGIGLIDLDFAAVGDPAVNLAWLVGAYPRDELARDLPADRLRRATLHRAAGPLQIAAAARAGGNLPLEQYALANFATRAAETEQALRA